MLKRLIIYFAILALSAACTSPKSDFVAIRGVMLGTTLSIKAKIPQRNAELLQRQTIELDEKMKRELSIFDKNSILSQINDNRRDEATPWIIRNITLADSISRLSDGVYDVTVAPLVRAYGFGAERYNPDATPNIDSILQFVGYRGLTIEGDRVIKSDPRMQIDLNSIAKGFAVDRLADIVESLGGEDYIVDIGGEIRLRGLNPAGEPWRIGVESPFDGNMSDGEYIESRIAIPPTSPFKAMATSGNYRRYQSDAHGNKIVHTIDPKTGLPKSSSLLSVTVIAPTCALADGYATMLLAAGDTKAEELAAQIDNCEVYLIYHNDGATPYRVYASPMMQEYMMK